MYKIAEIDNLNQAAHFSSNSEAVVTADSIETSKIAKQYYVLLAPDTNSSFIIKYADGKFLIEE